jgi:hypothetical protein
MEKELVVKLDEELIHHAEHLAKEKGKTVDQLVAGYFASLGDYHYSYEPMSTYARWTWFDSSRLSTRNVIYRYHHNIQAENFSTWYLSLPTVVPPAREKVQVKSNKVSKAKGEDTSPYNMSLVWAGDYPSGTFTSTIPDFLNYEQYLWTEVKTLPSESQTGWEDFGAIRFVHGHSQAEDDLSPITQSFVGILKSDNVDSPKSERQAYHDHLEEKYR